MTEQLTIYQQAQRSTASGRGVSYWNVPAMCGRKLRLMEKHKDIDTIEDRTALNTGTYYHFLKDFWLSGRMADDLIIDADPVQDAEWGEALRLFNWHKDQFPRDYWGAIVAVELRMPVNEKHSIEMRKFFGHDEATGACDLVVKMSQADVERIEADREVRLDGPGIYIVDHKTAGARKSDIDARATYVNSLQALTYMQMLSLAFNEQIRGMVFDVLVKHRTLRRYPDGRNGSSVQTFVSYPRSSDRDVVRAAFDYGRLQRELAKPNPFACYDHGRECRFLSLGLCGRY